MKDDFEKEIKKDLRSVRGHIGLLTARVNKIDKHIGMDSRPTEKTYQSGFALGWMCGVIVGVGIGCILMLYLT